MREWKNKHPLAERQKQQIAKYCRSSVHNRSQRQLEHPRWERKGDEAPSSQGLANAWQKLAGKSTLSSQLRSPCRVDLGWAFWVKEQIASDRKHHLIRLLQSAYRHKRKPFSVSLEIHIKTSGQITVCSCNPAFSFPLQTVLYYEINNSNFGWGCFTFYLFLRAQYSYSWAASSF